MKAIRSTITTGFVYIDDPRLIVDLAYLTDNNFLGRPVAGYKANVCILSNEAKAALIAVQDELDSLHQNYALKIFDAFRPTKAVADFGEWALDATDNKMQAMYYPDLSKSDLFKQSYLVTKSSHSRGSAVDVTIVTVDPHDKFKHIELDMGTIFDFFGEASHTASTLLPANAQANRQLLKSVMENHGFKNLPQEWWHYGLVPEPFPDTYFDFDVS